MQHIVRVGCCKAGAELASNLHGLVRRKTPYATKQRGQLFSLDVFHREEMMAIHFAYVVNAADIAMRNLTCNPDFTMKARERRAVVKQSFGQKLQSYWLT